MRKKVYIMLVAVLVALSWGLEWQTASASDSGWRGSKGSTKVLQRSAQGYRYAPRVQVSHFRPRSRVELNFGFFAPVYPYPVYPRYYRPYPVYPSYYPAVVRPIPRPVVRYGTLRIEVEPVDVEIIVDGRFIGLAGDFQGPAEVDVTPGNHVVEFRAGDYKTYTQVYVAAGSMSVVNRDLTRSVPRPPSRGSSYYRYYEDAPASGRAGSPTGRY